MTIAEILDQYGWALFCAGVALVFVIYTKVKRPEKAGISPDSGTNAPVQGGYAAPVAGTGDSAAITAAISAAVSEYRRIK